MTFFSPELLKELKKREAEIASSTSEIPDAAAVNRLLYQRATLGVPESTQPEKRSLSAAAQVARSRF
jgi:hypothetical protein